MLVWWGSVVEWISALARLERDGALSSPAMTLALQRLQQLSAGWHEIDPSDEIRETASRFFRAARLFVVCAEGNPGTKQHRNWQRPISSISGRRARSVC